MNKISMSGCSLTAFKFNLVEVKAKIYCKNKYLDFIHVTEVSKSTFRALKKRVYVGKFYHTSKHWHDICINDIFKGCILNG